MEVHSPEPPEPRRTGHHLWDILLSLTALVISGASMFTAYHTSHTMERLVQANSWPFLQLDSGNVDDVRDLPVIAFQVKNAGTGPARIHTLEFLNNGAPIEEVFAWNAIAQSCCAEELASVRAAAEGDLLAGYGAITTSAAAPGFLAPGEEATVLAWPRTALNQSLWHAMDRARQEGRITMRACFCSVFDECWVAETNLFPPRSVASCEPGAAARRAH